MQVVKTRCWFAKIYTEAPSAKLVPKLLSAPEIAARLKLLKGWKHEGNFVRKVFEFKEFMDGVGFVNKVAVIAEKVEHHPDINVRYTTVTLSVQTHSEGGVTEWDIELVEAIERMLERTKATSTRPSGR